ncbi:hypothetical protein DWF04_000065 [Cereibacter sphaeroides f. sp. denitrificans]|nr:hypothetical protein DWF04_16025 [Cereibacter sphaeroides f. sp. denitrificans]
MTDEELRQKVATLRARIQSAGSMHALWDLVFTGEAMLKDRAAFWPYPSWEAAAAEIAAAANRPSR